MLTLATFAVAVCETKENDEPPMYSMKLVVLVIL